MRRAALEASRFALEGVPPDGAGGLFRRRFFERDRLALDVAAITIGKDVQIGPNVQLLTPTHPTEPEPRPAKVEAARPITIGDNVWLGGGAIVCPGVRIGEIAVVGRGGGGHERRFS